MYGWPHVRPQDFLAHGHAKVSIGIHAQEFTIRLPFQQITRSASLVRRDDLPYNLFLAFGAPFLAYQLGLRDQGILQLVMGHWTISSANGLFST